MKFKEGVKIQGVRPELTLAIYVSSTVYSSFGYEMTITSVTDGKHYKTSLHYSGCAFDLRIKNLAKKDIALIVDKIKSSLTVDFDVVLESNHIHIEYQPRYKN